MNEIEDIVFNVILDYNASKSASAEYLRQQASFMDVLQFALNGVLGSGSSRKIDGGIEFQNAVGNSVRIMGDSTSVEISESLGKRVSVENAKMSWDSRLDAVMMSVNHSGHYDIPLPYRVHSDRIGPIVDHLIDAFGEMWDK